MLSGSRGVRAEGARAQGTPAASSPQVTAYATNAQASAALYRIPPLETLQHPNEGLA